MINYKSLIKKIAPFVLAGGLAGLTMGCGNKLTEPQNYTTEVLGLVPHNGYNRAFYTNQEGKVETIDGLPLRKDLPNYSKLTVTFKGSEGTIHIPSNSTYHISKNNEEGMHFGRNSIIKEKTNELQEN